MKISGNVTKPDYELDCKPIEGLNCQREEQSGKKFWGVIEEYCKAPENFFNNCFIHNYCPLAFLSKSGKNITPSELKVIFLIQKNIILTIIIYFWFIQIPGRAKISFE